MNKNTTLMRLGGGVTYRILSPALAALLTLQVSGCAFHSYQDVDKAEWLQIKERSNVRVTTSDSTVVTGHFAVLHLALDTAALVNSSILASLEPSPSSATVIITRGHLMPTEDAGFRQTKAVTDSTTIAVSEINRIEKRKGATLANCALAVTILGVMAALVASAFGSFNPMPYGLEYRDL